MKFKNVKNPNQKKVRRFVKILFPFFWIFLIWKLFPQKDRKFVQIQKTSKKKTLGLLVFSTFFFLGKKILHLELLALDKQKRGQGHGTESLEKLEERARKTGHNFIFLFSGPFRKKAHNFYRKNGFKQIFKVFFWKKVK